MRLDGMDSVTVGANRRLPIRFGDCLSVNALLKLLRNLIVALAAGEWNVELEDRGLLVLGVENLVRAVAVRTDCGLVRSVGYCVPVDALLIRSHCLYAETGAVHDEFLTMARSASRRNAGVVHTRFRVAGRQ